MRTNYEMLNIRLNLLKADCRQALNHARAVEFSQDAQAVANARNQVLLIKQFLYDLVNDCPDDMPSGDPLVTDTLELLNYMTRQLVNIRKK